MSDEARSRADFIEMQLRGEADPRRRATLTARLQAIADEPTFDAWVESRGGTAWLHSLGSGIYPRFAASPAPLRACSS